MCIEVGGGALVVEEGERGAVEVLEGWTRRERGLYVFRILEEESKCACTAAKPNAYQTRLVKTT